jgi:hypothetical protein
MFCELFKIEGKYVKTICNTILPHCLWFVRIGID